MQVYQNSEPFAALVDVLTPALSFPFAHNLSLLALCPPMQK